MPTEDHSSDRSHQGLPQGGVELSLDELAKGLASGTLSRGKAIRWMGGALLGAALASVPGMAWADDCRRLGRECRRDSQCCSRNCIRRGDEKVCGCPEGKSLCNDRCVNLDRNENHCGECFHRCEAGVECEDGMCQGGNCPSGRTRTEGDCSCVAMCDDPDFSPFACQNNPECLCTPTTEGTGFCANVTGPCEPPCSSSSDCPSGWKCIVNSCCGFPICDPPCSTSTSAAPASSAQF
jgi:hypothetical protein